MALTKMLAPLKAPWLKPLLTDNACPLCDSRISAEAFTAKKVNGAGYDFPDMPPPVCQQCFAALPWCNEPGITLNERSAFYYFEPIRQYILAGKSGKQLDKLQLLGRLMAIHFAASTSQMPQAIIPVPLHPIRLRQRGFNQSIELIRPLVHQFNIPLLNTHVYRNRDTGEQKGLTASSRQSNMHTAFSISKPVNFQHIAIFDDIITTGATCSTLKNLLLQQGVKNVEIWCCATTKQ